MPTSKEYYTDRLEGSASLEWILGDGQIIELRGSGMRLERKAGYGGTPFEGVQSFGFADVQYSFDVGIHSLLFGGGYSLEEFDERTPGQLVDRSHRFSTPALFFQDEMHFSDQWVFLASGRIDVHNVHGTFFTPRASLMFRPTRVMALRLGGGTGFKAPTIFIEEAEERGFRDVRPFGDLEAERAVSASLDMNWRGVLDDVSLSANLAGYLTRLKNAVVLVEGIGIWETPFFLWNVDGNTVTRGAEVSAKLGYGDFKLSIGYTFLYASQEDGGITRELDLNPRHSFGAVLVWESHEADARIGIEQYYTGTQRLEGNPFRDRSPSYWITGILVEKGFGVIRLFVNFENIFDTRQTKYESIITVNPLTDEVQLLPIYAPLEGRVINGGVRIVL
jgi:iron complex outermembrane receptor protein